MNDGCIKSDAFMHSMDDSRERERCLWRRMLRNDFCFVCVCWGARGHFSQIQLKNISKSWLKNNDRWMVSVDWLTDKKHETKSSFPQPSFFFIFYSRLNYLSYFLSRPRTQESVSFFHDVWIDHVVQFQVTKLILLSVILEILKSNKNDSFKLHHD